MKYSPHDYQRYAAEFIITQPVAALLLDMGLGKTSITLTAINDLLFDSFEVHKVLVVAPLRVARDTWSAEIEKWEHLKNLRYSVVVGTEQERLKALRTPPTSTSSTVKTYNGLWRRAVFLSISIWLLLTSCPLSKIISQNGSGLS